MEPDYIIIGSGLFHWNSSIKDDQKLEIINWYKSLSEKEKYFVDILRDEANSEGWDNASQDESF